MKLSRVVCLGLILVGTGVGVTGASAELPPAREPAELRTLPNGADYGKFDGYGKLLLQELFQDDAPADWYRT